MKKIVILTLILSAFVLALAACSNNANSTQLGASDFSIVSPKGYTLTKDGLNKDMVAYFFKDDNHIDLDVFQWAKSDECTLESKVNYFAAESGTVAESVTINNINGMKYTSKEEYEGFVYTVVNYMFEDDTYIIKLSFWTIDTAEEYAAVDEFLGTLKKS